MEPHQTPAAICAAIFLVLLAALFTGCLEEKKTASEPTPPAPPADDYGVQATATLDPSNPSGSATPAPSFSGGGDNGPPPLPG